MKAFLSSALEMTFDYFQSIYSEYFVPNIRIKKAGEIKKIS